MRILHAPGEIAGQVTALARAQASLGHHVDTWTGPHRFGYSTERDLWRQEDGRRALRRARLAATLACRYDVVHFHFASSLLPERLGYLDARLASRLGAKVVVQFWGSDVRLDEVESARNPYYVPTERTLGQDRVKQQRIRRWARVTQGHCIYADHSADDYLSPHFRCIHVARQAVDIGRLQPSYPDPCQTVPLIVHAPSSPQIKGTAALRTALEALRSEGVRFEYTEVLDQPFDAALETYRSADIIVDQLLLGSHGVFAAEAMALGKPVVCWVLPELHGTYPHGFPIVSANPSSIVDVLRPLLSDGHRRYERGVSSREYATRVHDVDRVVKDVMAIYEQLP